MPGQQLVHDRAERVDVGVVRQLERLHLLGRHVARAAGDAFDAREVGVVVQRDAEVDQPEVAVRRQHQVARLDVAVDHAARMRVVQRLGALEHQRQHVVDRQQVVGARVGGERARAVDELGDDAVVAALLARVVDRHDVRVLQHPDHVRLGEEHLARDLGARRVVVGRDAVGLDRDVAAVIGIVREVDGAGRAAPDLADHLVLADVLAECGRAFGGPHDGRHGCSSDGRLLSGTSGGLMSPDTPGGYFVKPRGTVNRIALHRGAGGPAVKWSKP